MNLAMSPEDEEVAGHVDIILKESSSSQQRRGAAGKVGHAVNESMAPSHPLLPPVSLLLLAVADSSPTCSHHYPARITHA